MNLWGYSKRIFLIRSEAIFFEYCFYKYRWLLIYLLFWKIERHLQNISISQFTNNIVVWCDYGIICSKSKIIPFDFDFGACINGGFEEHFQYLDFSWTIGEGTQFIVFIVLPFGLSTAGYIFTKMSESSSNTGKHTV